MKRLLPLLVFLLLIILILFFWQKQISRNNIENTTNTKNTVEGTNKINNVNNVSKDKKINFKPQKRQVIIPIKKLDLEIEVKSDENGVIITKIGGKPVEKRVSSAPVQRLSVKNGIMTFWEVNEKTKKLKYRSINLGAYVDRLD